MNHPSHEQWMSFCYNEVTAEERARLAEHLHACPHCSAAMTVWQQTQKDLNAWRLPAPRKPVSMLPWVVKWAAAALLLFTSFCLGRLSLTTHSAQTALDPAANDQWRRQLSTIVQQEVNKAASSLADSSEERTKQQLASAISDIRGVLQKMEAQRAADYHSLKTDLDTLAVNADAQLRTTERHLMQVATLAQPSGTSATP